MARLLPDPALSYYAVVNQTAVVLFKYGNCSTEQFEGAVPHDRVDFVDEDAATVLTVALNKHD